MSDVFISYSRKDGDFARQLANALTHADHDVWIDSENIPRAADWLFEIYDGIEKATVFAFIVSQHSLSSEICNYEIAHARKHNKRLIPLIRQDIDDDAMAYLLDEWQNTSWETLAQENWTALKHLNWIFFNDDDRFDSELIALQTAIEQNLDYIRTHKRLLVRALEWDKSGRSRSQLLIGEEIDNAEDWMTHIPANNPDPTALHTEYIEESRRVDLQIKAEQALREKRIRQFRLASIGLGVMVLVAIVAVIFATIQATDAIDRVQLAGTDLADAESRVNSANATLTPVPVTLTYVADEVNAQEQRGQAFILANLAQEWQDKGNPDFLAIPLALEALRIPEHPLTIENTLADMIYEPGIITRYDFAGYDVHQVAFSLDGTYGIAATPFDLYVWNLETGIVSHEFDIREGFGAFHDMDISPDGTTVALAYGYPDSLIATRDIATGEILHIFEGHTDYVNDVVFSPDGQFLYSASDDGSVMRWDVNTGSLQRAYRAHTDEVKAVAVSPDGTRIVSGGSYPDDRLLLWNVNSGAIIRIYTGLSNISALTFNADGTRILSGSLGSRLQLWNVESGERLDTLSGHTDWVENIAFHPDGRRIISTSANGEVIVWNRSDGFPLHTFAGHTDNVRGLDISPDGQSILTASDDTNIILWDLNRGALIQEYNSRQYVDASHGERLALHPSQPLFLSIDNFHDKVLLWDMESSEMLRFFDYPDVYTTAIIFHPDGTHFFAGYEDGTLLEWDMETGEITRQLDGNDSEITNLQLSADNRNLLSFSGEIVTYDLDTYQIQNTGIELRGSTVSPDGTRTLFGGTGNMILRDATTGEIIREFTGHTDYIATVTFSPDGRTALSGSWDATIIHWNLETGEIIRRFVGHTDWVNSAIFSPDARYVLSSGNDARAILWDTASGQALRTYDASTIAVKHALFTHDGNSILTASVNYIRRWHLHTLDELVNRACEHRYVPELTPEQRTTFGLDSGSSACNG